jgi:hypothetical protein
MLVSRAVREANQGDYVYSRRVNIDHERTQWAKEWNGCVYFDADVSGISL